MLADVMLKPLDIVVLVGLLLTARGGEPGTQVQLGRKLHLSQASIHRAMKQLELSRLWRRGAPDLSAIRSLVVHGVPFVYPAIIGAPTRGIPTAHAGPLLRDEIASAQPYVWPNERGEAYGPSVEPLHPSVPEAAIEDPAIYAWFSLVDALRVGRVRERKLAERKLDQLLKELA